MLQNSRPTSVQDRRKHNRSISHTDVIRLIQIPLNDKENFDINNLINEGSCKNSNSKNKNLEKSGSQQKNASIQVSANNDLGCSNERLAEENNSFVFQNDFKFEQKQFKFEVENKYNSHDSHNVQQNEIYNTNNKNQNIQQSSNRYGKKDHFNDEMNQFGSNFDRLAVKVEVSSEKQKRSSADKKFSDFNILDPISTQEILQQQQNILKQESDGPQKFTIVETLEPIETQIQNRNFGGIYLQFGTGLPIDEQFKKPEKPYNTLNDEDKKILQQNDKMSRSCIEVGSEHIQKEQIQNVEGSSEKEEGEESDFAVHQNKTLNRYGSNKQIQMKSRYEIGMGGMDIIQEQNEVLQSLEMPNNRIAFQKNIQGLKQSEQEANKNKISNFNLKLQAISQIDKDLNKEDSELTNSDQKHQVVEQSTSTGLFQNINPTVLSKNILKERDINSIQSNDSSDNQANQSSLVTPKGQPYSNQNYFQSNSAQSSKLKQKLLVNSNLFPQNKCVPTTAHQDLTNSTNNSNSKAVVQNPFANSFKQSAQGGSAEEKQFKQINTESEEKLTFSINKKLQFPSSSPLNSSTSSKNQQSKKAFSRYDQQGQHDQQQLSSKKDGQPEISCQSKQKIEENLTQNKSLIKNQPDPIHLQQQQQFLNFQQQLSLQQQQQQLLFQQKVTQNINQSSNLQQQQQQQFQQQQVNQMNPQELQLKKLMQNNQQQMIVNQQQLQTKVNAQQLNNQKGLNQQNSISPSLSSRQVNSQGEYQLQNLAEIQQQLLKQQQALGEINFFNGQKRAQSQEIKANNQLNYQFDSSQKNLKMFIIDNQNKNEHFDKQNSLTYLKKTENSVTPDKNPQLKQSKSNMNVVNPQVQASNFSNLNNNISNNIQAQTKHNRKNTIDVCQPRSVLVSNYINNNNPQQFQFQQNSSNMGGPHKINISTLCAETIKSPLGSTTNQKKQHKKQINSVYNHGDSQSKMMGQQKQNMLLTNNNNTRNGSSGNIFEKIEIDAVNNKSFRDISYQPIQVHHETCTNCPGYQQLLQNYELKSQEQALINKTLEGQVKTLESYIISLNQKIDDQYVYFKKKMDHFSGSYKQSQMVIQNQENHIKYLYSMVAKQQNEMDKLKRIAPNINNCNQFQTYIETQTNNGTQESQRVGAQTNNFPLCDNHLNIINQNNSAMLSNTSNILSVNNNNNNNFSNYHFENNLNGNYQRPPTAQKENIFQKNTNLENSTNETNQFQVQSQPHRMTHHHREFSFNQDKFNVNSSKI